IFAAGFAAHDDDIPYFKVGEFAVGIHILSKAGVAGDFYFDGVAGHGFQRDGVAADLGDLAGGSAKLPATRATHADARLIWRGIVPGRLRCGLLGTRLLLSESWASQHCYKNNTKLHLHRDSLE